MGYPVSLHVKGTNAADDKTATIFEKSRIVSCSIMDADGVTAHASNFVTYTVKAGSTTLATYTTDSAGDGTLTALTGQDLTAAVGAIVSAGSFLRCEVTVDGTGPAYNTEIAFDLEPIQ